MVNLLRTHRARQTQEQFVASNLDEETGFVSTTDLGQLVDLRNLLRTVRLAREKTRLTGIGVHTLRHTYATTALSNGVRSTSVSRNLGHSSMVITVDTCGHLSDAAFKAAAEAVSAALEPWTDEVVERLPGN